MFRRSRGALGTVLAAAIVAAVSIPAAAVDGLAQETPSVVGDWEGTLSAMGQELSIVFHITEAGDGALAATLDSPDQGAFGIPCDAPVVEEAGLTIAVPAVQGSYEGTINAGGTIIEGTWSQGPNILPLVLKPAAADTEAEAETDTEAEAEPEAEAEG